MVRYRNNHFDVVHTNLTAKSAVWDAVLSKEVHRECHEAEVRPETRCVQLKAQGSETAYTPPGNKQTFNRESEAR